LDPFDNLKKERATRFLPTKRENYALAMGDLLVEGALSSVTSSLEGTLTIRFDNDTISELTTKEILLDLNQYVPSQVTPLHFFTFTSIRLGYPLTKDSIP
jgi:hypothetical protein